jgi:hypothetical protein
MVSLLVRRGVAALGGLAGVASLAQPYATIESGGRAVAVAVSLDPRSPALVLGVLVFAGSVLAVADQTRGEQLLGGLFGLLLFACVVGPLVVPGVRGYPRPGLWLLLVGWVLVDVADDLDPGRSHARFDRWLPVDALTVLLVSGSAFLWVHRGAVRSGWTTTRTLLWALTGAVALGGWLVAVAWEWTAERSPDSPIESEGE